MEAVYTYETHEMKPSQSICFGLLMTFGDCPMTGMTMETGVFIIKETAMAVSAH